MQSAGEQTREKKIRAIDAMNLKIWHLRGVPSGNHDHMGIVVQAHSMALEIGYDFGIAQALLNSGMGTFIIKNNFPLAFEQLQEALELFKTLNDKKWMANAMLTISIINNSAGNREAALYNALKAFNYYGSSPD